MVDDSASVKYELNSREVDEELIYLQCVLNHFTDTIIICNYHVQILLHAPASYTAPWHPWSQFNRAVTKPFPPS